MLVAEAAYGGFAAKVFETQDFAGNNAKGGAISYQQHYGTERSFMSISYGGAYAKNERLVPYLPGDTKILNQDILFLQMETKYQKEFPLFESRNGKMSLAPSLGASGDLIISKNNFNGNNSKSLEGYSQFNAGTTLFYDTDPVKARIGAEVVMNFTDRLYNSERDKELPAGIYVNRYSIQAGATWEKGRLVASADTNLILSKTERQAIVGLGITDKKTATSCQAIYSIYDRNYGSREDYLVTKCSKDFSVQRLGKVTIDGSTRVSLNQGRKDVIFNLGASVKFR